MRKFAIDWPQASRSTTCRAFAGSETQTTRPTAFHVQLMGGMVLLKGMISEMKTGEGKTLIATLAVYLNAIEGKGVHLVTVNDCGRRDRLDGAIYGFWASPSAASFTASTIGASNTPATSPTRPITNWASITFATI